MTNGPLPPHERSWRHPSELPGPPPEPATRGGRLLIVAVGTVGLVLVGVLALTMTPDRADQAGDAVATTTLALLAPSVVTGDVAERTAGDRGRRGAGDHQRAGWRWA